MVQSVMERVILFLLSQIIFGVLERPSGEEIYFSPHPMREFGKILWHNGEAVGFYTIKKKGSLCDGFTRRSYQLSVLDTVFVRTQWRRSGLALQILADFCKSIPNEEVIGISCPISPSMVKVCSKYLLMHQDQRDRLYEVEAPGGWGQRRNIWLSIQLNQSTNSEALPRFGSGCTNAKAQGRSNVQQHGTRRRETINNHIPRSKREKPPADEAEGSANSKQAGT